MSTELTNKAKRNVINQNVQHCIQLAQIKNVWDLNDEDWSNL